MSRVILFQGGDVQLSIQLRDTPTARAIYRALPIEASIQTWGDEIYFPVDVSVPLESDARDVVEAGELAFWVEGQCIAIGFGPTPISRGNEIRLAARTNLWADTQDDVTQLARLRAGDRVRLEQA
jgi:hypothetical protein